MQLQSLKLELRHRLRDKGFEFLADALLLKIPDSSEGHIERSASGNKMVIVSVPFKGETFILCITVM
jgi:hypothetical protein